jgi:GT2 family glycosyltransferase
MTAPAGVIGVMILNYNGKQWLSPLYESIRRNGYPHVRIYLVDNCSTDGSVESTLHDYPDVTVIRMPGNLGYCAAYNLSMPQAFADGCEWVIWANNDVLLEPGCLAELAQAVQADPRICVAGPSFLSWESNEPNYYMKGKCPDLIPAMQARSRIPADVDWVEGSFLMVNRGTIEAVGALDTRLFIFWEEADFCRRARQWGKRVVLVPSARVRHFGGAFSEGRRDRRREWLHSRNFYIYTLTDPALSFARNLFNLVHLLAANIKVAARKYPDSVFLEIRAFMAVLMKAGMWHKKWMNIRRRIKLAAIDPSLQGIQPEILVSPSREVALAKQ